MICAANGHTFAGGLEMLLGCDFAYAVKEARFALTEVTLGLMPGVGGTQTLPRSVGERPRQGDHPDRQAFRRRRGARLGRRQRALRAGGLMPAAIETATRIAGNAPLAVTGSTALDPQRAAARPPAGMRFEIECYNRLMSTEDRREGIRAFNERRKPSFKGR